MELLEGKNLDDLVKRVAPCRWPRLARRSGKRPSACTSPIEHGLVHRDVKPGNLFLTTSGGVKVIDLGLARVTTPRLAGDLPTGCGP